MILKNKTIVQVEKNQWAAKFKCVNLFQRIRQMLGYQDRSWSIHLGFSI